MRRQLILNLASDPSQRREDFLVATSNDAAFRRLTAHETGALGLSGPPGSGKTHLSTIWCDQMAARQLSVVDLGGGDVEAFADGTPLCVEDVQLAEDLTEVARKAVETALFHALNLARAEGRPLLLSGRSAPSRWPVVTPDLASRLGAMEHVDISPPDDVLLSSILDKLLRDRQIPVSDDLIGYLVLRMERSFAAAVRIVAALDEMALELKRPVSRRLATDLHKTSPAIISGEGEA